MTPSPLLFNNPLDPAALDRAIDLLDLDTRSRVLDVGCGNGEILARVVERFGCRGIGVDRDVGEIAAAAARLAAHAGSVVLCADDVRNQDLEGRSFQTILCVGSTHAFGGPGEGYVASIRALAPLVAPSGRILLGEGYWKLDPDEDYLLATGIRRGEFVSHERNIELAEKEGLTLLHAQVSSLSDWDLFEGAFWTAAEKKLSGDPLDPDALAGAEHWRKWKEAYLRWGRDTLGFGLYLLRTRP